jgi:chaperonin GroEL (HSP60 family)
LEKKSELEEVCKKINELCGEELESYMPTLKNPRVIVFNVPEDITPENAVQAIAVQNSELNLNENEIKQKFVFEDRKKHKNLVIEVNSETCKRLVDRKLKLGWHVCNSSDYLSVTRCYKCSKYNHTAQECFGDVVRPHCAQNHKMHDCNASKENYRCVNCINYNKHNKTMQVNANHSSLDKSCGCYKAVLKKYTERLDY